MKGVSRNRYEVDGSNVKEETLVLKQLRSHEIISIWSVIKYSY